MKYVMTNLNPDLANLISMLGLLSVFVLISLMVLGTGSVNAPDKNWSDIEQFDQDQPAIVELTHLG